MSRTKTVEYDAGDPFNAAVGIKNGLIGGIAFWALAYALYSMVKFIG